jgi:hypothetical protein
MSNNGLVTSPGLFSAKTGMTAFSQRTNLSALSAKSALAVQNLDTVMAELREVDQDMQHLYTVGDEGEDTDDEDEGKPGFRAHVCRCRCRRRRCQYWLMLCSV